MAKNETPIVEEITEITEEAPKVAGLLDGMLTTNQVAAMLGVSGATVGSWRRNNENIPYIKMGKVVRYREEDVKAFVAKCLTPVEVS